MKKKLASKVKRSRRKKELMKQHMCLVVAIVLGRTVCFSADVEPKKWRINTMAEWEQSCQENKNIDFDQGMATPSAKTGSYKSVLYTFGGKRSPKSIVFRQSPIWQNWQPISNLGPVNLRDAPVMLTKGPKDYWLFGLYRGSKKKGKPKSGEATKPFIAEDATLDGFDIPLKTTPYPNQYEAPGGKNKKGGGYHAWQSRDMKNWVHHGPVTEAPVGRWVTTAEQVGGQTYILSDFPNDQDPHLFIDDDLTDGKPGKNMGLAFKDPSNGSDCAFIRDLQGNFHVIYEDWSPINAMKHSWDSPLAGHAVSKDGKGDFKILSPAVDERTKPTGKFAEHPHPHWHQSDPENYPGKSAPVDVPKHRIKAGQVRAFAQYEIHEPEQNAFGDWAAICIGGQYYLFADYHPAHDKIRVGWFTSDDINKQFTFCGELGMGHPDPDIGFAEGRFYLITQMKTDYTSPGPWVEEVTARVGADTNNDGTPDTWTEWQQVSESYDYIKGFSKQIKRIPATIDLSDLPPCHGICFEFRTKDTTENESKPILDEISVLFE